MARAGNRRHGKQVTAWFVLLCGLGPGCFGCEQAERNLKRPNLVRRAGDGRIYVSDFHHQRIVSYSQQGRYLSSFGEQGLGPGQLWRVGALLVEGPDKLLLINQRDTAPGSQTTLWEIKRFEDGQETLVVPLRVTGDGASDGWPNGLVSTEDGHGYLISDSERDAVLQFDKQFNYLGRWNGPQGGEPFNGPTSLRRRGRELWVVDQDGHRIRRMTLDGREILTFGREGSGPGQLRFPSAIDVCPGRWVAVADLGNYRVVRFDPEGHYLDQFEPPGSGPRVPLQLLDILVTPSCERLYLVDSKGCRVLVTTPTGQILDVLDQW